jgi:hypothetical protein
MEKVEKPHPSRCPEARCHALLTADGDEMEAQKMSGNRAVVLAPVALAAVLLLVAFAGIAVADPYIGGVPLTTVKEGVLSGDLWFDHAHPMVTDWIHEYTPPTYSDVDWARLYVLIYCGRMQENYSGRANISFNGVPLGGTPDNLSSEEFNVSYSYPGEGGQGPVWVNDHCVRVTSDYLMWYDVTDLLAPTNDIHVYTWATDDLPDFDGRIKGVTLVVAYDDGDTDTIHYWVNQGHDVDSYKYTGDYVGVTNFTAGLSSDSVLQSANLTVVHFAGSDGAYTFKGTSIPTDPSSTTTPPGANWQGGYSGYNCWAVSTLFTSTGNNTLTYDRTEDFYKIALAFMTANYTSVSAYDYLDTGLPEKPYPSIAGIHRGTLEVTSNMTINAVYTYPCTGTGGHTEFIRIWNETTGDCAEAHWDGYNGDYHNISFNRTLTLQKGVIYNYTIQTGSYPQIHHQKELTVDGGVVRCTKFTDANEKEYDNAIPAFKLYDDDSQ